MLRMYVLAAALLSLAAPAGAEGRTSSWSSDRMRLMPPRVSPVDEELRGNCAGLTVMLKTRIEWLKALEEKATQQQWPPPSFTALWERRPVGGDIARQRERIDRLNAALGAKGCQTVNVDAELRRASVPGTRARPR